jgi:hypothetical protein
MANMANDRIIKLQLKEGMSAKNSAGVTDNRVLTGENKLHAVHDPQTSFWSLHWDKGILAPPLQQNWTTWQKMMDFIVPYFERRNIEVKEIIENYAS